MFWSKRTQVCLALPAIFAIGFYISLYLRPSYHGLPTLHPLHGSDHFQDDPFNAATRLDPEDYIHRIPQTIHYTWNITSGWRAPDGVKKRVYLINGDFPGPVIEARSGDELVIEVFNGLDGDGVAIHWHGLSMRGANDMDGVVGLTQCAIPPFKTYTYRFKIQDDQSGTFWYHAHSELQRVDGLYGGLIIHKPGSGESEKKLHGYDEDLVLLVGDWYHRSAEEVQKYYTNYANFGNEPAPDSILMNGKGAFNCSQAVPSRPLECKYIKKPHLRINGKRTRLRIVNTGGLTGFTLSMSGHKMTVFQIDGGNAVLEAPPADSVGILYPGERMDVLVERSSDDETQEILEIRLDKENLKFRNFALTPIQHFPILSPSERGEVATLSSNEYTPASPFNLANASGPTDSAKPISFKADQTFLLYTKIEILAVHGNSPLGVMNRSSWDQSNSNFLPLLAVDRSQWGKSFVPMIGPGTENWVDIVLNNMDDKGHPFHLHGYSFYVLSTHKARAGSYDIYNPFDESKEPAGGPMNVIDPVMKDTVFVPRMGGSFTVTSCGIKW